MTDSFQDLLWMSETMDTRESYAQQGRTWAKGLNGAHLYVLYIP